ncbi:hypothetical protein Tco_0506382 [Tanacetum coccineum]
MTPRSCLRRQPTGKIFKTVGLRWVPTGKIFTSSTTKVDSEPTNGSNDDITNQYECEQTLDVSAGTLNLSAAMTCDHNSSELRIHDQSNEPLSLKLVPKVVPLADKTLLTRLLPVAHLVTSITLNSARSCVMQSAFLTQGTVSNIPIVFSWSDSIRPEGFLSSVLLWLVIIVAVVGVDVTVVVVVESSSVVKLSFVIT